MKIRTWFSIRFYIYRRFKKLNLAFLLYSFAAFVWSIFRLIQAKGIQGVKNPAADTAISILLLLGSVILLIWNLSNIGVPTSKDMKIKRVSSLFGDPESGVFPLGRLKPNDPDTKNGFKIEHFGNAEYACLSEKLDKSILESPLISVIKHRDFEKICLKKLNAFKEDFRNFLALLARDGARLFNENKIALLSDLPSQEVHLGKTHYLTSCVTNEASYTVIMAKRRVISDFRFIFPLKGSAESAELASLVTGELSNHIGVSLLAKTEDGMVVSWEQKDSAGQSAGNRVPGGSGSLNWTDIRKSKKDDLQNIIRFGMVREYCEESKVRWAIKIARQDLPKHVMIIGYFRWLRRGGKPEFIGIGKLPVQSHQLSPQGSEVDTGLEKGQLFTYTPLFTCHETLEFCESILADTNNLSSLPLKVLCFRLRSILNGELGSEEREKIISFWGLD